MRAAMFEHDYCFRQDAVGCDRGVIGGSYDHRLFLVSDDLFEGRIRDRLGDERGIDFARKNCPRQLGRITGSKLENDVRVAPPENVIISIIHFSVGLATIRSSLIARPPLAGSAIRSTTENTDAPEKKALVQATWQRVAAVSDAAAQSFYDRLFDFDPTEVADQVIE
jgi:hypothetical protein